MYPPARTRPTQQGAAMDSLTSLVRWVPVDQRLPDMKVIVLGFRLGGINKHRDVVPVMRQHKYGTRDQWEWLDMNGQYWGLSVDGSAITHWMELPAPPEPHSTLHSEKP